MARRLILPLMLLLTMATVAVASQGYDNLQAVSVRVDVGDDYGTGVLVTREIAPKVTRTFVWTAGHVVERVRQLDGTFKHATIYQEHRYEGNRIGASRIEAKVIAYSSANTGEDLALLEILQDNFRPVAVSATFYLEDKIPGVGTEVVHVGCTRGLCNSVSLGIISQTDRDLLETGKVFDQTSTLGYPGSSGGGVYLKENGACVGLLTRGMGPGLNFIVPARRLKTWAAAVGVMWALDPSVAMPTAAERAQLPLGDGTAKDSVQNVIIIRSNPSGDIEVVPVEPDEEPADNSATGSGERLEKIEALDRSLPGVSNRVAHLLHLSRTT